MTLQTQKDLQQIKPITPGPGYAVAKRAGGTVLVPLQAVLSGSNTVRMYLVEITANRNAQNLFPALDLTKSFNNADTTPVADRYKIFVDLPSNFTNTICPVGTQMIVSISQISEP